MGPIGKAGEKEQDIVVVRGVHAPAKKNANVMSVRADVLGLGEKRQHPDIFATSLLSANSKKHATKAF